MSHITKARGAALASVCRIVTAAERHNQTTIDVQELRAALDGVDVEGLANPRPCAVRNVGVEGLANPRPCAVRNVGRPLGVVVTAQA